MSNKYSLVEETRNGLQHFKIEMEGKQGGGFGGVYGRSQTDVRLTEYVGRKLRMFLLDYLVGKITEDELMHEAKDFCAIVKAVADKSIAVLTAEALKKRDTGETSIVSLNNHVYRDISNEIQRLEGPYSLYGMIDRFKCPRYGSIGTNVDDISVEITAMRDYTVKLEASINAYHELDGRILDEARSTEEHPVYMDGMRVCATIRGKFNDLNLFPLLQARLALMKGEPLKSLSKKSLTIRPVETA